MALRFDADVRLRNDLPVSNVFDLSLQFLILHLLLSARSSTVCVLVVI